MCATVTGRTLAELRARRDEVSRIADLVELRLDGVRDPDVAGALAGRRVPAIVTCRPRRAGGVFDGSEEERLAILAQALGRGAEYVDVEGDVPLAPFLGGRAGRGVVVSFHDFEGVPADLDARYRALRGTGAEVVKIAVTARTLCDNLPLLALGRAAGGGETTVLVAMGLPGLPSRVLAARFGSAWSYAGEAVAPGQLPLEELISHYRFRLLTRDTRIFGVVGRPIAHSVSPAIHNAAFGEAGLDAVYLPLAAASADDFRQFARGVDLDGASITAPFKVEMLPVVADADETARRVGAVNTLRAGRDGWQGRNTDVPGFLAPLDARGIALEGTRASVIGTGGAARAIVAGLAGRGARITVHGRDARRAQAVASLAPGAVSDPGQPAAGTWDLLVNATPVGTRPDTEGSVVDVACLTGGGIVYDLVYNPARTRLLRESMLAGCRAIGGLEMLVAGAAEQFEWWTGLRAPRATMAAAASARLARMDEQA